MSVKLTHDQFIYDVNHFPAMKDCSRESFNYFNRAVIAIANDIYKENKISPLTKAKMQDSSKFNKAQMDELARIHKYLDENKYGLSMYDLQSSFNFGTLFKFVKTTYGRRFCYNLGDIVEPKMLDWCALFKKLLQNNFDFENSRLLENYVNIGEELERAFNKKPKMEI